jgi:hypothetical protein
LYLKFSLHLIGSVLWSEGAVTDSTVPKMLLVLGPARNWFGHEGLTPGESGCLKLRKLYLFLLQTHRGGNICWLRALASLCSKPANRRVGPGTTGSKDILKITKNFVVRAFKLTCLPSFARNKVTEEY